MGSGVLLAALVVLWFVVLVPMVVTRGDSQGGRAELASSGRTLQRRRTVDPVVPAPTERVSIDRDALRTSGELQVDVHALRRRTLAGLIALAVLSLVGAVVYSPWLWLANVVLDLSDVAFMDSAGLAVLVRVRYQCEPGQKLSVTGASPGGKNRTKYRCMARNTATGTMIATNAPAESRCHAVPCVPARLASATAYRRVTLVSA